jgi:hypothetical protein
MPLTPEIKNNIFNKLKKELEKCCPPLVYKKGSDNAFEIIGNMPVPYGYKKEIVPGMFFASAVVRKDMVSFYFFPCYMNPTDFIGIAPKLFKCLKGKTCFNIKKEEQVDEKELEALFKKGIVVWKKMGYVK